MICLDDIKPLKHPLRLMNRKIDVRKNSITKKLRYKKLTKEQKFYWTRQLDILYMLESKFYDCPCGKQAYRKTPLGWRCYKHGGFFLKEF